MRKLGYQQEERNKDNSFLEQSSTKVFGPTFEDGIWKSSTEEIRKLSNDTDLAG